MIGKLDLVMWTYNSSRHLAEVFQRINEVIPEECINRKFIVDDHSQDSTLEIAKAHGWMVYMNHGKGIYDNIATAIALVSTPYFASFEHDIILAPDWWMKISKYMEDPDVAVAQGARLAIDPTLRKLDDYMYRRGLSNLNLLPPSLDNNIARTDVARRFGYEEGITIPKMRKAGWKWIVDCTVVSDHIRGNVLSFVRHSYRKCYLTHSDTLLKGFRILLTSPIRAVHIAYVEKCMKMLYVYPMIRFAMLLGSLIKFARNSGISREELK